jgi:hypothetical protein
MMSKATVGTQVLLGVVGLLTWGAGGAEGGWPYRRPAVVVPTTAPRPVPGGYEPAPSPMLGTFYPSPYALVRGNWPAGGGYSPLGVYGDQSMSVYGPLSPFRGYTAPVATYTRGYDGRPVVLEGTSFSTPNQPDLTPVVYPTQANYFYRIRETGDPPWWGSAMNWIDQN